MKKAVLLILLLILSMGIIVHSAGRVEASRAGAGPAIANNNATLTASIQAVPVAGPPLILLAKADAKSNGGDGKGGDEAKPDLRYVDWYEKPAAKKDNGNGNGEGNGDGDGDEEDDGDEKEGDEEEKEGDEEGDEEGFDRLWEVILFG